MVLWYHGKLGRTCYLVKVLGNGRVFCKVIPEEFYFFQREFNLDYQDSRKLLGRFGLPGHAHTIKIRDLSGRSILVLFY